MILSIYSYENGAIREMWTSSEYIYIQPRHAAAWSRRRLLPQLAQLHAKIEPVADARKDAITRTHQLEPLWRCDCQRLDLLLELIARGDDAVALPAPLQPRQELRQRHDALSTLRTFFRVDAPADGEREWTGGVQLLHPKALGGLLLVEFSGLLTLLDLRDQRRRKTLATLRNGRRRGGRGGRHGGRNGRRRYNGGRRRRRS